MVLGIGAARAALAGGGAAIANAAIGGSTSKSSSTHTKSSTRTARHNCPHRSATKSQPQPGCERSLTPAGSDEVPALGGTVTRPCGSVLPFPLERRA